MLLLSCLADIRLPLVNVFASETEAVGSAEWADPSVWVQALVVRVIRT